jgi:hypothetical protein
VSTKIEGIIKPDAGQGFTQENYPAFASFDREPCGRSPVDQCLNAASRRHGLSRKVRAVDG